MKLTIFGGTGRTGQHLVEQALAAGHDVTVLARTPGKLSDLGPQLAVVTGDIRDAAAVSRAVAGADALLSVLGPTSNAPDLQVSQGMSHILDAMRAEGVRRLIVSAGAGVSDPQDTPQFVNRVISALLKLTSRNVLEDMTRTVDLVRQSDRDWTIVRVPMLTDDPASGAVQAAYVGQGMGMRVGRADLAQFMLAQLDDATYLRQAPAISS